MTVCLRRMWSVQRTRLHLDQGTYKTVCVMDILWLFGEFSRTFSCKRVKSTNIYFKTLLNFLHENVLVKDNMENVGLKVEGV